MKQKILIISTCNDSLHELEFVKPIKDLAESKGITCGVTKYCDVVEEKISGYDKIIISGTSLRDFDYNNYLKNFEWLKKIEKPVLGICAGMQIIIKVHGISLEDSEEIGMSDILIKKDFLGMSAGEKISVYELHNLGINSKAINKGFSILAQNNSGIQTIKHKTKGIYALMFHPEVRNKSIIINFIKK